MTYLASSSHWEFIMFNTLTKLNSINKILSIESGNSPEESDLKTFAPQW